MNVKSIEERWNDMAEKLKKKYPTLKDEDLKFQSGNEEKMLKNLQIKTGLSRTELISTINKLEN